MEETLAGQDIKYGYWMIIASYNLQIFKEIYLVGHIQVTLLRLKSYTTHVTTKVTKIVFTVCHAKSVDMIC
jgi:hypothetical protein